MSNYGEILMKHGKYRCSCPSTKNGTIKQANFFSGNTNSPAFNVTNPFILSQLIRTASFAKRGKTVFASKNLNDYGRWEGALGGSGAPPRNTF